MLIFFSSGDIQPVQLPGRSWRRIEVEDHSYDQSRNNAVYPMTLMDADKYNDESDTEKTVERIVTRSGLPIAFVYAAYFEKETTFNAMNEFFRLCTLSQIDSQLRKCGEKECEKTSPLLLITAMVKIRTVH